MIKEDIEKIVRADKEINEFVAATEFKNKQKVIIEYTALSNKLGALKKETDTLSPEMDLLYDKLKKDVEFFNEIQGPSLTRFENLKSYEKKNLFDLETDDLYEIEKEFSELSAEYEDMRNVLKAIEENSKKLSSKKDLYVKKMSDACKIKSDLIAIKDEREKIENDFKNKWDDKKNKTLELIKSIESESLRNDYMSLGRQNIKMKIVQLKNLDEDSCICGVDDANLKERVKENIKNNGYAICTNCHRILISEI